MISQILGVTSIIAAMNALYKQNQSNVRKGLIKVALKIQHDAQENAPVDTGNLKASAYTMPDVGRMKGPEYVSWASQSSKHGPVDVKRLESSRTQSIAATQAIVNLASANDSPTVAVAFSAFYAIYVHEMHPDKSKFLERSVRENIDFAQATLVREMTESIT